MNSIFQFLKRLSESSMVSIFFKAHRNHSAGRNPGGRTSRTLGKICPLHRGQCKSLHRHLSADRRHCKYCHRHLSADKRHCKYCHRHLSTDGRDCKYCHRHLSTDGRHCKYFHRHFPATTRTSSAAAEVIQALSENHCASR